MSPISNDTTRYVLVLAGDATEPNEASLSGCIVLRWAETAFNARWWYRSVEGNNAVYTLQFYTITCGTLRGALKWESNRFVASPVPPGASRQQRGAPATRFFRLKGSSVLVISGGTSKIAFQIIRHPRRVQLYHHYNSCTCFQVYLVRVTEIQNGSTRSGGSWPYVGGVPIEKCFIGQASVV